MKREIRDLLNPSLRDIAVYRVEGGQEAEIKLNQNESPFDLPQWLKKSVLDEFLKEPWNRYPDILPFRAMSAYAEFLGVSRDSVIMSNGSNEMLYTIFLACLSPGRKVLIPEPSFSLYGKIARLLHAEVIGVPMFPDLGFDVDSIIRRATEAEVDCIVLSVPNNPTGKSLALGDVRRIIEESEAIVLVDEAYIEFSGESSALSLVREFPNLIVLRTMSKALSLAGMRIGFAIADPVLLAEIAKPKIPFSSSRLAEITLLHLLKHYSLVTDAVSYILDERDRVYAEITKLSGLEVFTSDTNFLVIRVPDAAEVFATLRGSGILVRNVSGYRLMENCLRFNIGLREENDRLLLRLNAMYG